MAGIVPEDRTTSKGMDVNSLPTVGEEWSRSWDAGDRTLRPVDHASAI